jgi:hypothetical protein
LQCDYDDVETLFIGCRDTRLGFAILAILPLISNKNGAVYDSTVGVKATLQAWFVAEGVSMADVDALLDDGGTVLV